MCIRDRTKWSLTAALAGFLFGFDTVVISGADQKLQLLWNSTDIFHGSVVMAMALWGTVVGAIFGGIPTRKIGRKKTLLWIGIFYTLSAIGSALANDPITFAIFRFIGGIGVGISGIAAPAYISEIAPAKSRGRLVGLYQFNLVVGILIAFSTLPPECNSSASRTSIIRYSLLSFITSAGVIESHPHDVTITREAPNYSRK